MVAYQGLSTPEEGSVHAMRLEGQEQGLPTLMEDELRTFSMEDSLGALGDLFYRALTLGI